MDNKPAIDPQNISVWIIASVCIGVVALLVGVSTFMQLQNLAVVTQGAVTVLKKDIEDVRKLAQRAAAPTPSSAPAQPTGQPAK